MKQSYFKLILFTCVLVSQSSFGSDFDPLVRCVESARGLESFMVRSIPSQILRFDRKLVYMSMAIPILEENVATLKQQMAAEANPDPLKKFLIYNSTASCQDFFGVYQAQLRRFVALVLCVLLTLLALTARSLFYMKGPGSQTKTGENKNYAAPPSDKSVSKTFPTSNS